MVWILFATLAHVANGLVFIVDKSLLGTKSSIGRPIQYALYSAALAGFVVVLAPFAHMQFGSFLITWSLIAGLVHIIALYVFFSAMRVGEPSRVVPIAGSVVPLFTVLFAVLFLGEFFTVKQGLGIALLIIGGGLLSVYIRDNRKMSPRMVLLPILAGVLFAAYFAIAKYIYDHVAGQFLGIFLVTRFAESLIAIIGILIIVRPSLRTKRPPKAKVSRLILPIFISNKVLAAGAFMLQQYAISLGSVSVVNALQGVQYVFVFMLAVVISTHVPKLFKEELKKEMLIQKIIGIVLVSFGIACLV